MQRFVRTMVQFDDAKRHTLVQTLLSYLPLTIEQRVWTGDHHLALKPDEPQFGQNVWRGVQYLRLLRSCLTVEECAEVRGLSAMRGEIDLEVLNKARVCVLVIVPHVLSAILCGVG